MAFHEVQFPTNISYNSRGGPGFNTHIVEVDSGAEERIARWSAPRRRYNARYGVRKHDDLTALQAFYISVQGPAIGFRYKDWLDFTTASNHRGAPTKDDRIIGTGDGTTTAFQLTKQYTNGIVNRSRNITKPVAGTVLVALNGINQTSGWTVNTTSGIITFSVAPSSGVTITAGCEFDVPVRFGSELDQVIALTIEDFSSGGIEDIPLVELVDESMTSDEFFYGGGAYITSATSMSITPQNGRALTIEITASGQSINLPVNTSLALGGPYFMISNASVVSVALKNSAGTTIKTLSVSEVVTVWLGLNASSQKVWYVT